MEIKIVLYQVKLNACSLFVYLDSALKRREMEQKTKEGKGRDEKACSDIDMY